MTKNEENWQNPNRLMKFSVILYVDASQQTKCYKKTFLAFFGSFITKKTVKIDQKRRKLAKSKPFHEIFWNLICRCLPTKKNARKFFFWISALFGRFLTKKQPKLTKNEKIWRNPNRSMKFSEIWYVDASQQKKCYKKTFFGFRPFLAVFNQKQSKLTKSEQIGKI